MNKQKIISLFLLISLFSANSPIFSAEIAKQNNAEIPTFKASASDYRQEYINKNWWDKYGDPILSGYITKAAEVNHNLKAATLKVSEAKALVSQSFGRELPKAGINPSYSRGKTSDTLAMGNAFLLPAYTEDSIYMPLSVNYELDIWLKNRDRTIMAKKEMEAISYDEKAAFISLTSAVAAAYFNVIKDDKQIQLQKDIIDYRKQIYELTKTKNEYGLCPMSDVLKAQRDQIEAESGLIDLQKQLNVCLNQLAVLTGQSVDNASSLKRASIDDIINNSDITKNIPSSISSEIVRQRPDLLKLEAELQKARIDVRLARKDFLPDINLTGQFGFNSNYLTKAFNSNSYITSGGINLLGSIFSGGQKKAALKAKQKKYEEMIEDYQQTILTSFQEVNDSLYALKSDIQKDNDNVGRIGTESGNLDLINVKYNNGAISLLDTLQYKANILVLKKDKTQSKTDCLVDSLSVYKAVGGKL